MIAERSKEENVFLQNRSQEGLEQPLGPQTQNQFMLKILLGRVQRTGNRRIHIIAVP